MINKFDAFGKYHKQVERLLGQKLVGIQTDTKKEFENRILRKYGIKAERMNAYMLKWNDYVECKSHIKRFIFER